MSILVNETTKVVVQGITGKEGSFHTQKCLEYGTDIVAGVTPGKGGQTFLNKIPIFNTMEEAVTETNCNTSLIFVPPPFASDAMLESVNSNINLIVCITEGIPVQDSAKVINHIQKTNTRLIGPNCPGLISPKHRCKIGIMPAAIHTKGTIGVVSRSGTLTYEAVSQLSKLGLGQSTCIGIGGDPITGMGFNEILTEFDKDPETESIVLIGEIGGQKEQEAATTIKTMSKPVAALIVGESAPTGKRMGHAGAIITGTSGTAKAKIDYLKKNGAEIIPNPSEIGITIKKTLK
tara:strand:+ start:1175 stop:2047 length:873 start_codon:yes stop_codon:yes gene_type:complete